MNVFNKNKHSGGKKGFIIQIAHTSLLIDFIFGV